ncbi:arylamine N-acetyltransferase [Streptacidiphilus sp. N1-12]|uniref:Arylamine N-acetyltransferase n=2 Tax=Streptacidiphilus alkalitolerans TaxID=3342712 RepID=A0ABV6V8Y6_9ACTN
MTDDQAEYDEWETGTLDLDAYLRRIGWTGGLRPDGAVLTALHRAHLAAIPFENLDLMLGRGIRVDLGSVQAKLVGQRRGGYCFEHGTLFAAVLTRAGFRVRRLLARTGDDPLRPRARSHLVLKVAGEGGEQWLADVGFGSGLLEPLPFREDAPRSQGGWTYRLVRDAEPDGWWLTELQNGQWARLYRFTEEPQHAIDVEVANHYVATHPASPFLRRPVVIRKDDRATRELLGRHFAVVRPDRAATKRDLPDGEVAAVLREEFGIELSPEEAEAVVRRIPA